MNAFHLPRPTPTRAAPLAAIAAFVALCPGSLVHAQTAPPPPVAVPPGQPAAAQVTAPSAAVSAVIAAAQAQVKAGKFDEAVAVLTAAQTPGLGEADKQALDFAMADFQSAIGGHLVGIGRPADALVHLRAALALDGAVPSRRQQFATDLRREGIAFTHSSDYEHAIDCFERVLLISIADKNLNTEARDLGSLGIAYDKDGRHDKSADCFQKALTLFRELMDQNGEAIALEGLGNELRAISQYRKAIAIYEEALPILRAIKDENDEAIVLVNLGSTLAGMSDYRKAIEYYSTALPILRRETNRDFEAHDLMNMGTAYVGLSEYGKAIALYEQAIPILHDSQDRDGEAIALMNLGGGYCGLNQYAKGIEFYGRALPIFQDAKDRNNETKALMFLGDAYDGMGVGAKATVYFEQALPIFRELGDRNGEADDLMSLGATFYRRGQYSQSASFYEEAKTIYHSVQNRDGEARGLTNLGNVYDVRGQWEKAIGVYQQALAIFHSSGNRDGAAICLAALMETWMDPRNPRRDPAVATLLGKEAINWLQSMRVDIRSIDKSVQRGFLRSKERPYRFLAYLLAAQRRVPEALQVLDLLKQEEYLNFNQQNHDRPTAEPLLSKRLDFTPREQRCDAALETSGSLPDPDTAQQDNLEIMKQTTTGQKDEFAKFMKKQAAEEAAYLKILSSLPTAFPTKPVPALDRLESTSDSRQLQAALSKFGDSSVAIYTIAADKNVWTLLVTPNKIVAHSVPIKTAGDLDRKISAFRAVLQDPYSDPRPLGKQVYDLLIAPIRRDLDRAHAKTLLVSLDGNLRYIPLAALSPDGKHYLVETYRTALYTPAAIANLTRQPKAKWTAVAMGVSKVQPGFQALTAVPDELRAVARTDGETGPGAGQFPGERLLDGAFTRTAMVSALGKDRPLVHIASHFNFTGDETTSFLLLGDGTHMTLSDMKTLPDGIFAGVNLLTLSACATATGNLGVAEGANGSRDVENVAVLAQRKGADAVLASLWSVSDGSTGLLMRTFYRDRQGGGPGGAGESKAEALRQAQIALLTGTAKALPNALAAKRSELLATPLATVASTNAPAFTPDPKKPWAHPYYWAPFILIGNWK